ncbi:hypothetical protein LUZ60_013210 [Juncus effusus]|nr:hypothetical protein LUZ60_013210 [Juncus effusus]
MGRPDPCVLFAQTILHSQLDEYVDEVLFSEPVVITACEFLEQNAAPSTPNISLVGATLPPSFALEVFVHCEGESRFRRLCQPFLYSHSSSNVLEVEAIVTNHLVLRGTYRSLTLVIYGNTAEDLGQFNIDFGLDSSLANVVYSPSEGKFEDLPPALHASSNSSFNAPLPCLKSLIFKSPELDLSDEVSRFLSLALNVCEIRELGDLDARVLGSVVSCVCNFAMVGTDMLQGSVSMDREKLGFRVLAEAKDRLAQISKDFGLGCENEMDLDLLSTEMLVEKFMSCFPNFMNGFSDEVPLLSQNKLTLALALILLLCFSKEGCLHFSKIGGMNKIIQLISQETKESTFITLLVVSIIECGTRHGIGCESFLGWSPAGGGPVPVRTSQGYSCLLRLLLEKQRHDVASLATYVLHRLHFYETLSRFESAIVSLLTNLPQDGSITSEGALSLVTASSQLTEISKLLSMCEPIENPSPVALARKMVNSKSSDGLLSYKATIDFIAKSKYSFTRYDTDPILLSLLKERGFFPLCAALLSSPILKSASGAVADIFVETATSLESILLSLLLSRSGLTFLLDQAEATELLVLSLKDVEDSSKTECMNLRQASVLLSKGFFCHPREIGAITELHFRVVSLVDRLLVAAPNSDELLWLLWELCAISRSDSGRQVLLALGYFPEAVSVLLESLRSYKDQDQTTTNTGSLSSSSSSSSSSLSLAICHSASEVFEVLVTDSTAASLNAWIEMAVELHKALHLSSPGSNRKDAPTRLLEWIDAGVVYHRNGAIGLLRYAAVLASGGDAHLSSARVLVSDSIDVEMVVNDASDGADGHGVIDNLLGKLVSDKYFEGVVLSSTSIAQLTTAFRILAFTSEDLAVAASLFEEGAITLVYVVLVNCKFMLQRLSNSYDYLVDEGAELSSTADLLLDRSHEQELVDLMIPSLLLLIHVLKRLQETKVVFRNKKLLSALLHLHRELSPKLGASATDLSFLNPSSGLGFGAVCHLITSAVASWPVCSWAPNLFHRLLEPVDAKLPVGPKDASSLLCLLGDLFPDEGIWQWRSEIPPLSAVRNLSISTFLGPLVEKEVNWYMNKEHVNQLISQLTPQLENIAIVVLNFSISGLMVIQDMLRVFIVRLACQRIESAIVLLKPVFSRLNNLNEENSLSDMDSFQVHQLLHFLSGLLEHLKGKELLCKMGLVKTLFNLLERCKQSSNNGTPFGWRIPLLKCFSLIFSAQPSIDSMQTDKDDDVSVDDSSLVVTHLLNLLQELPVEKEMLACALTLKDIISSDQGRNALALVLQQNERNNFEKSPPFLRCFEKIFTSLDSNESPPVLAVQIIYALSLVAVSLPLNGDSLEGLKMLKCLFGLPSDWDSASDSNNEKLSEVLKLTELLDQKLSISATSIENSISAQAKEALKSIPALLQNSSNSPSSFPNLKDQLDEPTETVRQVILTAQLMPSLAHNIQLEDEPFLFFSNSWKSLSTSLQSETDSSLSLGLTEKFIWELPQTAQSAKRRLALVSEPPVKRAREGPEINTSFSQRTNLQNIPTSSGPTRRDTFRQRKPNTSRPPSMHVDDYVARERNIDGASIGSNIIGSSQRGRPPSIHVDEFMARERGRQNSAAIPVASSDSAQVKTTVKSEGDAELADKQPSRQQPKTDLFDEHEIDIVFDEEIGSDDKGLFPQPDENLQSPPVITGENSPDSSDAKRAPHKKENNTGDKQNGEPRFAGSPVIKPPVGPSNLMSLQGRAGQPPLPPMPPPVRAMSAQGGQGMDQLQSPFGNPNLRGLSPPLPPGFPDMNFPNPLMNLQIQHENMMQANNMMNQQEANKFPWNFVSGGMPLRPMPPLPPQPYSNPLTHLQQALNGSDPNIGSSPFGQMMMNRPMQMGPGQQQRTPPPPPPPVPHPSQTMQQQQNLGFGNQMQLGFGQQQMQFQNMQMYYGGNSNNSNNQQNQMMGVRQMTGVASQELGQQVQLASAGQSGQTSQNGQNGHSGSSSSLSQQQQQDSAAALQQYFSSPEAIQSLLSDRDKLCELLERHPKLMQMLQEKLGQL